MVVDARLREAEAEANLRWEVASYKEFLAAGGNRGSVAGRARRQRIGELVVKLKEAKAAGLRITDADEEAYYEARFADVDVFGSGR